MVEKGRKGQAEPFCRLEEVPSLVDEGLSFRFLEDGTWASPLVGVGAERMGVSVPCAGFADVEVVAVDVKTVGAAVVVAVNVVAFAVGGGVSDRTLFADDHKLTIRLFIAFVSCLHSQYRIACHTEYKLSHSFCRGIFVGSNGHQP